MSDDEREDEERVVAVQTMMYSTRTMQEGDEGAETRQLETATTDVHERGRQGQVTRAQRLPGAWRPCEPSLPPALPRIAPAHRAT